MSPKITHIVCGIFKYHTGMHENIDTSRDTDTVRYIEIGLPKASAAYLEIPTVALKLT
jgi:hypothetical protein